MKKCLFCFLLFSALIIHTGTAEVELGCTGYPAPLSEKPQIDGEVWNEEKLNVGFPFDVLRDVTVAYKRWETGTPINALGLLPNSGAILRSSPDFGDNSNIVQSLHADETVYVYFEIITDSGVKWYYVVNEQGLEGYIASSRVWVLW